MNYVDPWGLVTQDVISFKDKLSALGPYGNPADIQTAAFKDPNKENKPYDAKYEYKDISVLAAAGEYTKAMDSQEDAAGTAVAISAPSAFSNVKDFGSVTLTTYDKKTTKGLDGYEVSVTSKTNEIGIYTPTVLDEKSAKEVLERHEALVDETLNQDRRSTWQKVVDALF